MYVDPFIFGIVCTIGTELLVGIIILCVAAYKSSKENNNG